MVIETIHMRTDCKKFKQIPCCYFLSTQTITFGE